MDQYIGKLLDNRYEILELVGVGGMARVYKARCHRLNRLVAIKILREDLAQDSELRRRFHDESQAVAMLSHPNIVSVYDVSRSPELEYIVMELIDGITLKQYMQKKGNKLNWREALHFITQIIKALGHAHSRGIIHRDIKPHNVMVLRDGSVKVADFGIARLATGGHSTLTQEALGSVHYISPEQARGSHIDARSDLYSAGVVLYEMITGRLPFEGDTPVSVAIQHINSIPLSPREIDPNIPEALEAITMKAMAPNPSNRYANADEMLADLEEFRKNPSINFDYKVTDFLSSEEVDTDKTQVAAPRSRNAKDYSYGGERIRTHRRYEEDTIEQEAKDGFPWPIIGAVGGVLIFVIAVFYFLFRTVLSDFFAPTDSGESVPYLIGSVYEEIKDNKDILGDFEVVVGESVPNDTAKAGTILEQSPEANSKVDKDEKTITVTLSSGPNEFPMIDIYNMEIKEAYLTLKELGLTYSTDYEYHETVEKNHVISFTPYKDTPVTSGDEVHMVISMGPKVGTLPLPSFSNLPKERAESDIQMMNLKVAYVDPVYSDTVPEGYVVNQYPVATTVVDEGTTVNLQLSKGPDPSLAPEEITKEIEIPLPDTGEIVNLVVMVDGDVVLDEKYETALETTVPLKLTAKAGSKKSVTYFFDGTLKGSLTVEFNK